jgi:hypothetical protein
MGSPSFLSSRSSLVGWLAGSLQRYLKHVTIRHAPPWLLGTLFHRPAIPKILHRLFLLSSDSQWAFSHSIAASIGNVIVAVGTLVSRDAQRIKRSVVNHFRQYSLVWRLFHSRSTFQHLLPGAVAQHSYNAVWACLVPFLNALAA